MRLRSSPASRACREARFKLGYSPERINPGDKEHTFEKITKVVSGEDEATLDRVAFVYGKVVKAGVHRAPSIKVAEAAKVIENTQRDLNIALMNELALIFDRMDIRTSDVLAAAGTKWNFLPFRPGLVGGHCIGVDPYYLTTKAQQLGYQPEVILAGRRINNGMGPYVAQRLVKLLIHADIAVKGARVGVLGLTFKENCSDLRNSKVPDIVSELGQFGIHPFVHDPVASAKEAKAEYGLDSVAARQLGTARRPRPRGVPRGLSQGGDRGADRARERRRDRRRREERARPVTSPARGSLLEPVEALGDCSYWQGQQ